MVVILAAGMGSRMNLAHGVSKCSVKLPDGRSSVRRLIDQFVKLGETKFTVVVGYGASSVVEGVGDVPGALITWIYNNKTDCRGCEYSLASAAPAIDVDEDLIIVEGDLVTTSDNLAGIVEEEECSAVLVRSPMMLSRKSVAVVCSDDAPRVLKFLYDSRHSFDMKDLVDVVPNIYDSFQVWKICSKEVESFKSSLEYYKTRADSRGVSKEYQLASGLLTINNHIIRNFMTTISVPLPTAWINLNSEDDIKFLEDKTKCAWYYS